MDNKAAPKIVLDFILQKKNLVQITAFGAQIVLTDQTEKIFAFYVFLKINQVFNVLRVILILGPILIIEVDALKEIDNIIFFFMYFI
jgi:hypothetical protein